MLTVMTSRSRLMVYRCGANRTKKRGVAIREAFNQIHRYSKESFNSENSLFKYLQLFVISNGTDTRYFANTTKRDKNSFDFTMNWAKIRQYTD